MASTYKDLQAQIAQLTAQAEEQRKAEMGSAIDQIRNLIHEFGLTERDIGKLFKGSKGSGSFAAGAKVAPKYTDPATGATWSGRGLPPKWIAAAHKAGTHDKFLIEKGGSSPPPSKRARKSTVKKAARS
jgi:DNA-binding protein H-NS